MLGDVGVGYLVWFVVGEVLVDDGYGLEGEVYVFVVGGVDEDVGVLV